MTGDVVELLCELIALPSVNPESDRGRTDAPYGEGRVADYVERFFEPFGLNIERQEAVAGRETDRFDLGDGRYSHPQSLNYVFQDFKALGRGIARFKVIQSKDGERVTVLVQPSDEWRAEHADAISAVLRDRLGYRGVINLEVVPEIPRDPSGKLRYFVRER